MKNISKYNVYTFISTMIRGIIDVYSVVYLYKLGVDVKNIVYMYMMVYFLGVFLSEMFLKIGNKIGYKYILILSSLVTSFTFYIINNSYNLYLIAIFLSLSIFTYHPIKHYYGLIFLKGKKRIGNNLILVYIATLLASFVVMNNLKISYLIIISIVGIIPALFMENEKNSKIYFINKISCEKLSYFIFDQFKVIFILLEPLYLYMISSSLSYVGIFNIILTISSVMFMYLLINKISIEKSYKYLNLLFIIILILKINILNENLLLIIAFFEGIGIKMNELVSTINLYDYDMTNVGYLILAEKIFCLSKTIILVIIYLLPISLKMILYFLIIGIFILSFQYKKNSI